MFDMTKDEEHIGSELQDRVENKIYDELYSLIKPIKYKGYNLVLITNEVGCSLVPSNHISRVFRDIQGRINQRVATISDKVYLVSCGIPVKIK